MSPETGHDNSQLNAPVAIVRCDSYGLDELRTAVSRAIELLGGLEPLIGQPKSAMLKMNLSGNFPPERAITTHPNVGQVITELLQTSGATVSIGDSSIDIFADQQISFETTGIAKIAEETGAEIRYFEREGAARVEASSGRSLYIAGPVHDAECVISVPKFKTHMLTGISVAVKNLFGCQPGRTKVAHHRHNPKVVDFVKVLADVAEVVNPALTIVDAVVGMDGEGPSAGRPVALGLILASRSPAMLDLVSAEIMGYEPFSLPLIAELHARGLIPGSSDEVSVVGERLADVRPEQFHLPSTAAIGAEKLTARILSAFHSAIEVRPIINHDICVRCGACFKICPTSAVEEVNDDFRINDSKCIRCFCCHEVCPHEAIEGHSPWPRRLLKKTHQQARNILKSVLPSQSD